MGVTISGEDIARLGTARDARSARAHDRVAIVVVWSVLLAMTGLLLFHVARDARNVPLSEDWYLVRPLVNDQPHFLDWIWAQNDEHRTPVQRLVYLGLLKATHDFRVAMVFDIVLVAAAAGGLVLVARRVRGHTSLVDAFFPIVLLNLGNSENLLWGWQMQFVLVLAGLCALLGGFVTSRVPMRAHTAVALGVVLALLPFGGGSAMPAVPALIAGLVILAWSPGTRRTTRRVVTVLCALCLAAVVTYFVGWHAPTWYPKNPGPGATLRTTAKALALAWGPVAEGHWLATFLAAAAVLVSGAFVLVRPLRAGGDERRRALAVALFIGGILVTALGIGYGRAAQVPTEGVPQRYTYVTLPALLGVWFAWELFGSVRARKVALGALLLAALVVLPVNMRRGYGWRDYYAAGTNRLEHDIRAGIPRAELVRRNREFLLHWDPGLLAHDIELLRKAGIGPFARLRSAPPPSGRGEGRTVTGGR